MCVFYSTKILLSCILSSTRLFIFGRALGNPLMKRRRLLKAGSFVTGWRTLSFQRLNLLYGVHFSVINKDAYGTAHRQKSITI